MLKLDEMELIWIETIKQDLLTIPTDESKFVEMILPTIDKNKILLSEYGL
jgi:hypothetical protein